MPGASLGSTREAEAQALPARPQLRLAFGNISDRLGDVADLRRLFREMVEIAGGVEWLAISIGKPITYASKISEALAGVDGRHIQLEVWLPPLLEDARAKQLWCAWNNERCGYEAPKPKRVVTRDEMFAALLDELEDAGGVGDALRERAAKRIGTDKGAFRK